MIKQDLRTSRRATSASADSAWLLREAERCFRLAHGTAGVRLSEELEAIGREFQFEARERERALREA